MKYIICFLVFLASCQLPNKNISDKISDAEVLTAKNLIQGAFDDLWAGVDSIKVSKYHTDDFVILENGVVWDNNRIKEYMRKTLSNNERAKRTNRMEYISIDKYGDAIQIAYYNFAEFTKNDSIVGTGKWLESSIAIPTDDGWRLKMMHSTWAKK